MGKKNNSIIANGHKVVVTQELDENDYSRNKCSSSRKRTRYSCRSIETLDNDQPWLLYSMEEMSIAVAVHCVVYDVREKI